MSLIFFFNLFFFLLKNLKLFKNSLFNKHFSHEIVLLWLGPLFETLPRATLAGIIIVALKGMIMQVKDLKKFYRESTLDVVVWITTFLTVVIIDIDVGLLVGVVVSFVVLYIKGFKSYSCLMGQVSNTEIYVDLQNHKHVAEIPHAKIFRYYGSINFATSAGYKSELFAKIGVDHRLIRRASLCETNSENRGFTSALKTLVIDLSCVPHIDISGYRTFLEIRNELKLIDVRTYLASPSDCVSDLINRAVKIGEQSFDCFPTVHDAVLFSNES